MYQHFVVNAFPRSGSVFLAHCLGFAGVSGVQFTSLHIPYIIGNDKIQNAVVIRNPYDCISSLLYKNIEDNILLNSYNIDLPSLVEEYSLYIEKSIEFNDSSFVCLVDFNSLIHDPASQILKCQRKFNLKFYDIENIENVSQSVRDMFDKNSLLNDKDGHMPREKTDLRKSLEQEIANSPLLIPAYSKYLEVIDLITS